MTRHLDDVPTCPACHAPVIRTHTCRARPARLSTMPPDFRDQVAAAVASGQRANGRTDWLDQVDAQLPSLLDVVDPALTPTLLAQADATRAAARRPAW